MWQLDGNKARLETSRLNCNLDLAAPDRGLTGWTGVVGSTHPFQARAAAIMQLTLPSEATRLADAYVRGNDLVATYEETKDHPCRTQVYWRIVDDTEFFGIQLIVSVQTSKLDATPTLTVASQSGGPPRLIEEGVVALPLSDSEACYVEIADESNIESTVVENDSQITNRLFPGTLEKGVIRRARILGVFLSSDAAVNTARTLRDRFVRSSLPLTT